MIVLDTNVLSEAMKREPEAAVMDWLDSLPPESVWITSITVFEISLGLEKMPSGRRRSSLRGLFVKSLEEDFQGRVLDFDLVAANAAAVISAGLHRRGHNVDVRDVQIAGIVAARKGTLATRNTKDFAGTGLKLLNPWDASRSDG